MNRILYINACFKEGSRTNELAQHLLSTLDGQMQSVELFNENIRSLDFSLLSEREELLENGKTDDEIFLFANQFAAADTLVIAAPYWDLMFPSVLKSYFENITVNGITFRYAENGKIESLCKAKELYYVTTSGGYIGENNFGFDYGCNDCSFHDAFCFC